MEPLPETVEAIDELDPFDTADDDLLDELRVTGARVQEIAPQCVGMSLTMRRHGVTLTLVSQDDEIAMLDAVQYAAGGPCVEAVDEAAVIAVRHDDMDEEGWHLFAAATSARGVASTLSMPILDGAQVVGGVNLYGATTTAFDDHHDALAEALGSWAAGAVTNADLSFRTREAARRAPQQLRDSAKVDTATGLLASHLRITLEQATERLRDSARLAGIEVASVATLIIDLLGRRSPGA